MEVQINNLRIGNYVNHSKDGTIKVCGIVCNEGENTIMCEKGNWHWERDLDSIALTSKWLKMFGFRKLMDIAEWEMNIISSEERTTIGVDFDTDEDGIEFAYAMCIHDDVTGNMIHLDIYEVHHLQNLCNNMLSQAGTIKNKLVSI